MAKSLIIVESPTKIKTLRKFLGADYIFESSLGHIRDLPQKGFGIDVENNFEPEYTILPDKKEVIEKLKKAAKQVDIVYLSPDPDREGEAIAWHIASILPKGTKIQRVTFNAITKDGEYLGGAITAGVNLAAEALFTHAAKLPRIDLQRPPSVIGRNTVHAMQSGLLFGYVSMVEGMVTRFRSELGSDMKVIATGGLAEVVAKETRMIDIIAPWLTLDGLRLIWELNQ